MKILSSPSMVRLPLATVLLVLLVAVPSGCSYGPVTIPSGLAGFKVSLIGKPDTGAKQPLPVPRTPLDFEIEVQAMDEEGQPYREYRGTVCAYVSRGMVVSERSIPMVNGKGRGKVRIRYAHGVTWLWAGAAAGNGYCPPPGPTGETDNPLCSPLPPPYEPPAAPTVMAAGAVPVSLNFRLLSVQDVGHNDGWPYSSNLERKGVQIGRGKPVVTAVYSNGFFVTDVDAAGLKGTALAVGASEGGKLVVTGDSSGRVVVWQRPSRKILMTATLSGPATGTAISPDGKMVAAGTSAATPVALYDPAAGKELRVLGKDRGSGKVAQVAFSPDSKLLAVAYSDRTATLYNTADGKQVKTFGMLLNKDPAKGHTDALTSVAFGPKGRILVTGSKDKTAIIWEVETGKLRATAKGHVDTVTSVSVAHDGSLVSTTSSDRTVKLWNPISAVQRHSFGPGLKGASAKTCQADSECGTDLCFNGKCWRREVKKGHTHPVNASAFCKTAELFATASDDWTVKLWSTEEARMLNPGGVNSHGGPVVSLACVEAEPDYKDRPQSLLITGSADGTVRLWLARKATPTAWSWKANDVLGQEYNSLFIFTFSAPEIYLEDGVTQRLLTPGEVLTRVEGAVDVFSGVNQVIFPSYTVGKTKVTPPKPRVLIPDRSTTHSSDRMSRLEGSLVTLRNAEILPFPLNQEGWSQYRQWPILAVHTENPDNLDQCRRTIKARLADRKCQGACTTVKTGCDSKCCQSDFKADVAACEKQCKKDDKSCVKRCGEIPLKCKMCCVRDPADRQHCYADCPCLNVCASLARDCYFNGGFHGTVQDCKWEDGCHRALAKELGGENWEKIPETVCHFDILLVQSAATVPGFDPTAAFGKRIKSVTGILLQNMASGYFKLHKDQPDQEKGLHGYLIQVRSPADLVFEKGN